MAQSLLTCFHWDSCLIIARLDLAEKKDRAYRSEVHQAGRDFWYLSSCHASEYAARRREERFKRAVDIEGEEAFDRGMEGRPRRCGMPGTADHGETQLGGGLLSATTNSRSCIAGRELPRHDGTDQIDVGGQLGNHWPRPRLRKMAAPQALPE